VWGARDQGEEDRQGVGARLSTTEPEIATVNQVLRWLIVSGGALVLGRSLARPLKRFTDGRLAGTAWILLASSWAVVIAETFLPVKAIPPFGIILFLMSLLISVGAVAGAAVLALVILLRRSDTVPSPADAPRTTPAIPVLILLATLICFLAERIIGIVAAVNG
jgi:hypothetical protein